MIHLFDQFRAFVALREEGQGEEAIAAAFFVTPQIVKQRLKLASVAPALLEVYAEDGMTLEQLGPKRTFRPSVREHACPSAKG